jgi:hypothetical protein
MAAAAVKAIFWCVGGSATAAIAAATAVATAATTAAAAVAVTAAAVVAAAATAADTAGAADTAAFHNNDVKVLVRQWSTLAITKAVFVSADIATGAAAEDVRLAAL